MRRDLDALARERFDLLVVGGGIFGACAAADASARGLSVALLERDDFAAKTSANSFKVVHGGIRYLQHGDLSRLRRSSADRRALLRIAPHLVEPLAFVVPTFGGSRDRLLLRAGALVYDALTLDRNRGIADDARRIPRCRTLDAAAVARLFPQLGPLGASGALQFSDGQIYNPPRLVLGFVEAAARAGAVAANYVEAESFLVDRGRVVGVRARDRLGGATLDVRARCVVNAAGPYAEGLVARALELRFEPPGTYSRDACFVVDRRIGDGRHGLAVLGRTSDPDAIVSRGARHLFLLPWRGRTLVGVWHKVHRDPPEAIEPSLAELEAFLEEIDAAVPGLELSTSEVTDWHTGLVPFGENDEGAESLRYGHRSRLVDHRPAHGLDGLISLVGVRLTTGRREAERAVDLALRKLGRSAPACVTARRPLPGGEAADLAALGRAAERDAGELVAPNVVRQLVRNYGSAYVRVLERARAEPRLQRTLGTSDVIAAQVALAVEEEMAQTLADVVLRRTDLATGSYPGDAVLEAAARTVGASLGWSRERERCEVDAVARRFAWLPRYRRPAGSTEEASSARASFPAAAVSP